MDPQATLADSNEAVFLRLAQFAQRQHKESTRDAAVPPAGGAALRARVDKRPVPAALVVAGGVNASDHVLTFPALLESLREQVPITQLC